MCDSAVKGGSLAMHDGLHSDHTMKFVDFDQERLFGNESFTPIIGQIWYKKSEQRKRDKDKHITKIANDKNKYLKQRELCQI